MNNLKDSASPYLRSAAHQPINWQEWGEAAFAKARAEGKPILLDVGAVWCHWCHVIDRESYENPAIRGIINGYYIPVKVDRDERPDVDSRYQSAVSAVSGQGGWPLTGFLTPEGRPFFGGTYFPPEDAMGRPGFRESCTASPKLPQIRREEVDKTRRRRDPGSGNKSRRISTAPAAISIRALRTMVVAIIRMFDLKNGGFGRCAKISSLPGGRSPAGAISIPRKSAALLTVVERTLEKMAQWRRLRSIRRRLPSLFGGRALAVPHFEKMSYDNSELLKNYSTPIR